MASTCATVEFTKLNPPLSKTAESACSGNANGSSVHASITAAVLQAQAFSYGNLRDVNGKSNFRGSRQAYAKFMRSAMARIRSQGVSHLAIVVSAPTLIALNSTDRYRPAAMTLWGTFFGVAFALTGWFGLTLVESQGMTTLYFVHGLMMGAIALLVMYVFPDRVLPTTSDADDDHRLLPANLFAKHKSAWTSPSIAAPASGWFFYTLTFVALLTILPKMMQAEDRAFTAAALPLANGALAQAGNLGNLCGTPLLLAIVLTGGVGTMTLFIVLCYVFAIGMHMIQSRRRQRTARQYQRA